MATSANRLFVNSGTILSIRVESGLLPQTSIREVKNEELDRETTLSWSAHRIVAYRERIASFLPPAELTDQECNDEDALDKRAATLDNKSCSRDLVLSGWVSLLFF